MIKSIIVLIAIPAVFKDKSGNLLFSASSVNVGPSGRLSNGNGSILTASHRLPKNPEWAWGSPKNPSSTASTGGWRMGMSNLSDNEGFAKQAGAIVRAPKEIYNWVKLFGNDLPIWNAYEGLKGNQTAFYNAVSYVNEFECSIKGFMGSTYTEDFIDALVNFIVDGSLPMGENLFPINFEKQRLVMGYGIQILNLKNARVDDALNSYYNWVKSIQQKIREDFDRAQDITERTNNN